MKILHLGKFYSPIEGGIESINRFIVDTLTNNQQRVISFNCKDKSVEDTIDGIPVVRVSSKGIIASQPVSIKYYWELKRNLRMFNPDIIHFHYPNPLGALYLLLSIQRNNKLIVHWHSDVVSQKILHKLIFPIEKRLLKRADSVIATSPNYAKYSSNLQSIEDKVTIIPCSIDESRFKLTSEDESEISRVKNMYCNKPIVFFIGRHVEYKGIKYLLEAERFVKSDCSFVIAGQGPLTEELKKKYNSSRIHWIGRLNEDEMRWYYHAASVFAFPSITRNEAFGVVLAEAMYCGCPPVTFTIEGSGVNWVSLDGVTGIEVANKDIEAYATAIDKLLSDDNLLMTYRNNGRDRVINMFTKSKVGNLYLKMYNEL